MYRSINTLAVLSRYLSIKGIDKALLLSGSGIEIRDLDDPDAIITTEQELLVIRNLLINRCNVYKKMKRYNLA